MVNSPYAMAAAALATVAITACGGERLSAAGRGIVTDSAGVQIVVNPAEDRPLDWTFERVGVLNDSLGEPWLFERANARGVAVSSAGVIHVLDGQAQVVERFASDGSYLGAMGRKGGGPGEFEFPISLLMRSDTLLVRDMMKRGLVRFTPNGEPLADYRVSERLAFAGEMRYHSRGLWMDGSIQDSTQRSVGFYTDTLMETPLHQLVMPPGRDVRYSCVGISGMSPLFSPRMLWSSSGDRAVVNPQPGYTLWVYDGANVVMSVRRAIAPRAPTIEDARVLYPEGWKVSFGGAGECVVEVEKVVEQQGLAEAIPEVQDLFVFPDGSFAVRRTLTGAEEHVVDVFAADGQYQGTGRGWSLPVAVLPNGEWLMSEEDEFSGGRVLARVKVSK